MLQVKVSSFFMCAHGVEIKMILVSACLAGLNVRYDSKNCLYEKIRELMEEKKAVSVCPEVLGGLSIPREPAEIIGGDGEDVLDGKARVVNISGQDVTAEFLKGAYAALEKSTEVGASLIILKESSPSCGSSMIHDGQFSGRKIAGNGVTSALLKRNGFNVMSEVQFLEYISNHKKQPYEDKGI